MASRKISTINSAGFTLIEMLIVIGLIAMIGSVFLFIDLNSYRGDAFRSERDTVVTLLGQARIEALDNVLQEPHGVAIFPSDAPDSYVTFAGASYALSDPTTHARYKTNYKITLGTGSVSEVVFEQLNGNANLSGTITLVDPNRAFTRDIVINTEGGISW